MWPFQRKPDPAPVEAPSPLSGLRDMRWIDKVLELEEQVAELTCKLGDAVLQNRQLRAELARQNRAVENRASLERQLEAAREANKALRIELAANRIKTDGMAEVLAKARRGNFASDRSRASEMGRRGAAARAAAARAKQALND